MEAWEFLLIMAICLPIMALWVGCIIDIIARPDISGVTKALWMLLVIFFPLFGSLIYVIVRPRMELGSPNRAPTYSGWDNNSVGVVPRPRASARRAEATPSLQAMQELPSNAF